MNEKIQQTFDDQPKPWKYQIIIALVVAAILAWSGMAIEYKGMSPRGPEVAFNILKGIATPDLDMLFSLEKTGVPYLLLETFCIAFLGTILGTIISLPLSFLGARNVMPRVVAVPIGWLAKAIRTIPAFVYGLMFIRVTGPGPFAGVLTMSMTSVGMLTKRNSDVIENIDTGVLESLDATGCTSFQKIRYGILPQLSSHFVSNMIYRFDINMKHATVLGLVGAGGIGVPLITSMNAFRWNVVGTLLIGLVILVLLIEYLSTLIRVKLARG